MINGKSRPTEESFSAGIPPALAGGHRTIDRKIADFNRANADPCAILYLLKEKPAALLLTKHEDTTGSRGDRQSVLQELAEKYNNVTDEVIRVTMEKLVNTDMKNGQDTDYYFMKKTLTRSELDNPSPTAGLRIFACRGLLRSTRASN